MKHYWEDNFKELGDYDIYPHNSLVIHENYPKNIFMVEEISPEDFIKKVYYTSYRGVYVHNYFGQPYPIHEFWAFSKHLSLYPPPEQLVI